jgi:hypothetical protein
MLLSPDTNVLPILQKSPTGAPLLAKNAFLSQSADTWMDELSDTWILKYD